MVLLMMLFFFKLMFEMLSEPNERQVCTNCRRRESNVLNELTNHNATYKINIEGYPMNTISRKKLGHFTTSRNDNSLVPLCKECARYLNANNITFEGAVQSVAWPSFCWGFLSNAEVREVYGIEIWRYIPKLWRYWWIGAVQPLHIGVNIDEPEPYFVDRTCDSEEMKKEIESGELSRLAKTLNTFLIPDVLCPWGESEYIHKCGFVELDIIFQRHLQKVVLKMMGTHLALTMVRSSREDYIREPSTYKTWIQNPNWRVQPTIIFTKNKGPRICTSRNSNGGNQKDYLHIPRQPRHVLPSIHGDQLCHAVIRPRTIKPMVAKKYSNCYQMHEQKGSFQGIDTYDVTNYGDFGYVDYNLDESEARSIRFRPDINMLLDDRTMNLSKYEETEQWRNIPMKKKLRSSSLALHLFPLMMQ